MFESELSNISSELIRSALFDTIENELKSKNYKIKVESASQYGTTNLVGVIYRVFVREGDGAENEQSSLCSLILKVTPKNCAQFNSRPSFLREIYMFDEILPYFRAFEKSKGVNIEDNGFTEYPKCYRTIDMEHDECLMLEDLKNRGFEMINRHKNEVTVDHVRLYLQALAKYHAVSLAIKDQRPEKFQDFSSNVMEIFMQRNNAPFQGLFAMQTKYILNAVSADEDAHLLAKLKKIFEGGALNVAVDCIEAELSEAVTVISYGDANQNNSLFRYDKNRKPTEICLLDWQASREASPIIDIIFFIFCSTTKELRDTHYEDLLQLYYESLSAHIRRLGSNPEKIFPYEMMLEHLRKFAKLGIIIASIVLISMTSEPDTVISLDDVSGDLERINSDSNPFITDRSAIEFQKRMHDVIADMNRLGYI